MAKLSKSQRKKQKVKLERKAAARAKAYSRHKEYRCYHYSSRLKPDFLNEYTRLETEDKWEEIYKLFHDEDLHNDKNKTEKIILPPEIARKFALTNDDWRDLVINGGIICGINRYNRSPIFPNKAHEYYSLIEKQGEQYICPSCKYKFTKEQYEQMNELLKNTPYGYRSDDVLRESIEPVRYYYSAPNKRVYMSRTEKSR